MYKEQSSETKRCNSSRKQNRILEAETEVIVH